MKEEIEDKIKGYKDILSRYYDDNAIGEITKDGASFTSEALEYMDLIEMMIDDLKQILEGIV